MIIQRMTLTVGILLITFYGHVVDATCRATESFLLHSVFGICQICHVTVDKRLAIHYYYLPITIHTIVPHIRASFATIDTIIDKV